MYMPRWFSTSNSGRKARCSASLRSTIETQGKELCLGENAGGALTTHSAFDDQPCRRTIRKRAPCLEERAGLPDMRHLQAPEPEQRRTKALGTVERPWIGQEERWKEQTEGEERSPGGARSGREEA